MSRARALRTLSRFDVGLAHAWFTVSGERDWSRIGMRVKPRGHASTFIVVEKPTHMHIDDFRALVDAIGTLATPKEEKK